VNDTLDRLTAALSDRYRLERELGAGGMATVFQADDVKHRRKVAVKVLRPELAASLGAERFLREIETTANLRHPHILPLYDSGEAGGLVFYVMPLVEGESLRDRLRREKQLPIDDALRIAREVADGLSYAHSRGVIHRDIKPENILLESGHAVIADFGIARAIRAAGGDTLTQTGVSIGTPLYMSPEQAAGDRELDGRSDLYSLGCVLYEMLAGQPPFTGPTAEAITRQHLIAEPPPVTNLRPAVPAAVMSTLQRALAKNPADRFNPVAQFAEAIQPAALSATTAPAGVVTSRLSRGRIVAGLLLAALVVTAVFAWQRRGSPKAPLRSIAVLPFADRSSAKTDSHLGDGIAETLINALANLPGLTVTARTSAFFLRDRADDVREIGKQLSVATVLVGSVQRADDRLRITAQVVRTADGVMLWSQQFDRRASDIFAVQDEVARSVAAALQLELAATGSDVTSGGTRNPAAYEAYLLGRYHWNRRTADGMVQATAAFKNALAADSSFAQAWSGLADAYTLSIPDEYNVPGINPDSILTLAEQAARRAIALAPGLGEAYASLGEVLEYRDREPEAIEAFERGITLSPSYATGHQWYSYALQTVNRWDEAIREMEAAHRLDPLSHVITLSLAMAYDGANRFAEATPLYAQGLAQSPEAWYAWIGLFGHELALGRFDAAVSAYHRAIATRLDGSRLAEATRQAEALADPKTRDRAVAEVINRGDPHLALALARWLRGDSAAVSLMESIVRDGRWKKKPTVVLYPILGPALRGDPRMQASFRRLGFPPMATP
jgi:serine/threonine-protein kinase